MNIDERLEALTQSVELLASMHRDHESHFEEHRRQIAGVLESLLESQRQLAENQRRLTENHDQLTSILVSVHEGQQEMRKEQGAMRGEQNDLREAIIRLSVIAEAHQDTLDDHSERLGQ